MAKVVGIMADGRPIELILPASRRVMLDWVRQLLRATEAELQECFTDCGVGAIPALRHWRGVDLIMDGPCRSMATS